MESIKEQNSEIMKWIARQKEPKKKISG